MKLRVLIRLKPGVLDAQGRAIGNALGDLGYDAVTGVRVGKLIELEVAETDPARAQSLVREVCEKLLANPVIETFSIES
ncbi:MAG TPA: phosphoribosylformylglycinamidine synthase subunit PurS [Myxococcota bacterium]|nr:phosphoribosylformylglycinamidine synthase subunit PurS [Myxococcota bacterium]